MTANNEEEFTISPDIFDLLLDEINNYTTTSSTFGNKTQNFGGNSNSWSTISQAPWFRISAVTVYAAIVLFSLFGNTLLCVVIWRSEQLRTITNLLIANLGIANIGFTLVHPLIFISKYVLRANWLLGTVPCKFSYCLVHLSATASFYSISVIAVDRWVLIFCRQFRITKSASICVTVLLWLAALGVGAPYFYFWREIQKQRVHLEKGKILVVNSTHCSSTCIGTCLRKLEIITVILQYALPLCFLLPAYAHLALFVWKQRAVGEQTREKLLRLQARKRRMVGTILAIVSSYLICWLPLLTMTIFHMFRIARTRLEFFILAQILATFGPSSTPFLYLMNEAYRTELGRLFNCGGLFNSAGAQNFRGNEYEGNVLLKMSSIESPSPDDRRSRFFRDDTVESYGSVPLIGGIQRIDRNKTRRKNTDDTEL